MITINLNNISISNINGADYHCIINGISKSVALNLLKKCWFAHIKRSIIIYKSFFTIYKVGKKIKMFGITELETTNFINAKTQFLLLWKGRVGFKQYIPKKQAQFGIKMFFL